ncbi:hypothetical protein JYU34_007885 [Plutella xylostella]|uniref:Uncharacterized protein n=1 Tax=Plutella xylostella TaxID=51655 RepID=A0ABQ7QRH6_PLUXY|nr:hypothetical protein JYU34_007885 [Plutella xylostella]
MLLIYHEARVSQLMISGRTIAGDARRSSQDQGPAQTRARSAPPVPAPPPPARRSQIFAPSVLRRNRYAEVTRHMDLEVT